MRKPEMLKSEAGKLNKTGTEKTVPVFWWRRMRQKQSVSGAATSALQNTNLEIKLL